MPVELCRKRATQEQPYLLKRNRYRSYGLGIEEHDKEGRVMQNFGVISDHCVYTPNSQSELARLDYRMRWEKMISGHICCSFGK